MLELLTAVRLPVPSSQGSAKGGTRVLTRYFRARQPAVCRVSLVGLLSTRLPDTLCRGAWEQLSITL